MSTLNQVIITDTLFKNDIPQSYIVTDEQSFDATAIDVYYRITNDSKQPKLSELSACDQEVLSKHLLDCTVLPVPESELYKKHDIYVTMVINKVTFSYIAFAYFWVPVFETDEHKKLWMLTQ